MAASTVPATRAYRSVLSSFATGVVVVTGMSGTPARPAGMSISSFTSVSLDPPLVSFCVAVTSTTWPLLRTANRWCVNVLGADQRAVCDRFAVRGVDRFAGCDWRPAPGGSPIIGGAIAWFEVRQQAEHVAGDHVIVVGRVEHCARRADRTPLILFGGAAGTFRSLASSD
ncbi:flavin reductase family protein [Micromonospora sp. NPDC048871]|uniref:flavin reductase family protein n=1 Tax=unclassified Micromonospora TaxID=2617518 RepID=UPI002E123566|nr:flavin reductase family protein [Micromonospora sp. NBC_01739]